MLHELIVVPIIAGLVAQALKLATDRIKGNFNLKNLISDYGGMPSSHAAFVAGLATMVGLQEGVYSAYFAIAFIIALIVIRDAVGLRRQIGRQSQIINQLIQNNKLDAMLMSEQVGHRWQEIFIGAILGLAIALIFYFWL